MSRQQNPYADKRLVSRERSRDWTIHLRVFLLKGTLGFLWFFAWMYFVHDTPREHPTISKEELKYIETTVGKEQDHLTPKDEVQY